MSKETSKYFAKNFFNDPKYGDSLKLADVIILESIVRNEERAKIINYLNEVYAYATNEQVIAILHSIIFELENNPNR